MEKRKLIELKQSDLEKFDIEKATMDLNPNVPSVFAGGVVRAAAKAGWFNPPIDPETIGDMLPSVVNRLMKTVSDAYQEASKIDPE